MRVLTTLALVLVVSIPVFSQTTSTAPVTVYEQSYQAVDSVGNLVVFDFGYAYTPAATGRRLLREPRTPMARITVVRPAGAPETHEYAASLSVVGIGKLALYAVATSYTTSGTTTTAASRLIALNPQVSLPAALTSFANIALPATHFDVASTQPDILSILTAAIPVSTGSGTPATTTPRTVKVVKFNGVSFDTVSTATLP